MVKIAPCRLGRVLLDIPCASHQPAKLILKSESDNAPSLRIIGRKSVV